MGYRNQDQDFILGMLVMGAAFLLIMVLLNVTGAFMPDEIKAGHDRKWTCAKTTGAVKVNDKVIEGKTCTAKDKDTTS